MIRNVLTASVLVLTLVFAPASRGATTASFKRVPVLDSTQAVRVCLSLDRNLTVLRVRQASPNVVHVGVRELGGQTILGGDSSGDLSWYTLTVRLGRNGLKVWDPLYGRVRP